MSILEESARLTLLAQQKYDTSATGSSLLADFLHRLLTEVTSGSRERPCTCRVLLHLSERLESQHFVLVVDNAHLLPVFFRLNKDFLRHLLYASAGEAHLRDCCTSDDVVDILVLVAELDVVISHFANLTFGNRTVVENNLVLSSTVDADKKEQNIK